MDEATVNRLIVTQFVSNDLSVLLIFFRAHFLSFCLSQSKQQWVSTIVMEREGFTSFSLPQRQGFVDRVAVHLAKGLLLVLLFAGVLVLGLACVCLDLILLLRHVVKNVMGLSLATVTTLAHLAIALVEGP